MAVNRHVSSAQNQNVLAILGSIEIVFLLIAGHCVTLSLVAFPLL